jgi:AcrR family transcriptional regulator
MPPTNDEPSRGPQDLADPAGDSPRRGNRAEQRAATRRKLLDATIDSIYELGYARTTTLEVQARAGVSRGTLLHQFGSRTELVMAAVDHLGATRHAALHEIALRLPRSAVGFDVAVDVIAEHIFAPRSIASLELWNASRSDPELADAMRRHDPVAFARIADLFDLLAGPRIVADQRYPPIRDTLLYAIAGAAIGRHLRPAGWLEDEKKVWKALGRDLG